MIKTENLGNRVRHYSDARFKLQQIETGLRYDDAVNVLSCKYTYEKTDEPIDEEPLKADEVINVLLDENK